MSGLRVNEQITAPRVRVMDREGHDYGIVSIEAALRLAKENGLALVELLPHDEPPMCRLMPYDYLRE